MSSYTSRQSTSPTKSVLTLDFTNISVSRRTSGATSTTNPSPTSTTSAQRVQLIPYGRDSTHESFLCDLDKEAISATYFDSKDISSQDFDFDDIFTYDRPQQKLSRVVEVSSHSQRDWSSTAPAPRYKAGAKSRGSMGDVYVKNAAEARKR